MKMEFVRLQKEDIKSATDYLPMLEKRKFLTLAAANCIERISVSLEDPDEYSMPMPDYYKENQAKMHRYLMGAFVKLYLKKEFEPIAGDDYLMAQDDFDRWAGGHVFNQIDRAKKDTELKDKCFDILEDYNNLRRMFYAEVHSLLATMNDPCQRIMAMLQMQGTPENVSKSIEEVERLKKEWEAARKQVGDSYAAASAI